jgi:Tfp pilus assembly protein PilF
LPKTACGWKKALWLNPDFSSPYILLGKVYTQVGQLELAAGVLEKAISMDPNNAGVIPVEHGVHQPGT